MDARADRRGPGAACATPLLVPTSPRGFGGFTEGLTTEQIWATPDGFGPVGFHLRHIAGSVDRLTTYLEGGQISEAQLDF